PRRKRRLSQGLRVAVEAGTQRRQPRRRREAGRPPQWLGGRWQGSAARAGVARQGAAPYPYRRQTNGCRPRGHGPPSEPRDDVFVGMLSRASSGLWHGPSLPKACAMARRRVYWTSHKPLGFAQYTPPISSSKPSTTPTMRQAARGASGSIGLLEP